MVAIRDLDPWVFYTIASSDKPLVVPSGPIKCARSDHLARQLLRI